MHLRFLLLLIAAMGLMGCETMSARKAAVSQLPSSYYQQQTEEHLQRFYRTNSIADMKGAVTAARQLYRVKPDDIRSQDKFYKVLFQHDFILLEYASPELNTLFGDLDKNLQPLLSPPEMIAWYLNQYQSGVIKDLRNLMQRYPGNRHVLTALAAAYNETEQYWMASAVSSQAMRLYSNNADLQEELGYALKQVASADGCRYNHKSLMRSAATHMAKAAVNDPTEYRYSESSYLFLSLGIVPLAKREAELALKTEDGRYARAALADVAAVAGDFATAFEQTNINNKGLSETTIQEYRAMYYFQQAEADNMLAEFNQQKDIAGKKAILDELRARWMTALAGVAYTPTPIEETTAELPWLKTIKEYFLSYEQGQGDADYLIAQASDVCERSEAHFYTAYRFWLDGETEKALEQLKLSRKQPAYFYYEYIWQPLIEKKIKTGI